MHWSKRAAVGCETTVVEGDLSCWLSHKSECNDDKEENDDSRDSVGDDYNDDRDDDDDDNDDGDNDNDDWLDACAAPHNLSILHQCPSAKSTCPSQAAGG